MFLNASQFQMRWLALSIGHLTSVFSLLSFELNVDSFDFAFLLKSGFLTTLDFGDSNFEVDGMQLSKRSCTWDSFCSQLSNSTKLGIRVLFSGDSMCANHRRFISYGNLLTAISRLLDENKSFVYPNCCRMLTNDEIVSANSTNADMSLYLI